MTSAVFYGDRWYSVSQSTETKDDGRIVITETLTPLPRQVMFQPGARNLGTPGYMEVTVKYHSNTERGEE